MVRTILAGLVTACAVLMPIPAGAHGDARWIMDNPTTRPCCGPQDCRPLELASDKVEQRDGHWYVNGYQVPDDKVFPTRDGTARYWACFFPSDFVRPRCLFIPAGV